MEEITLELRGKGTAFATSGRVTWTSHQNRKRVCFFKFNKAGHLTRDFSEKKPPRRGYKAESAT